MQIVLGEIHVFDLEKNPGLMKMKVGEAAIQNGNIRIVHIANLQYIDVMFRQIEQLTARMDDDNNLRATLNTKISGLTSSLNNLKPRSRVRRSWEGLGSAIKWLAGNADADDLRDIQENFRRIEEEQNKILEAENLQLEINGMFEDRINTISKTVAEKIFRNINETLENFEIINLMFNLDLIKEEVDAFNNAIILAKANLVTRNILLSNSAIVLKP